MSWNDSKYKNQPAWTLDNKLPGMRPAHAIIQSCSKTSSVHTTNLTFYNQLNSAHLGVGDVILIKYLRR